MGRMICIDPGKSTGIAIFSERDLIQAMVLPGELVSLRDFDGDLWIEVPRIYPGGRGKGDPNVIVDLAFLAGRIAGGFRGKVHRVFPAAWKATVPKGIMTKRILGFLTAAERTNVPNDHNAIDAVGIGLWVLGRMGRGGR